MLNTGGGEGWNKEKIPVRERGGELGARAKAEIKSFMLGRSLIRLRPWPFSLPLPPSLFSL